ncbi:hypothetical protein WL1483_3983 [Aeromonas schubertii]|uniref:Uncharacterized protein n=1 Tax=Aeromonas schubertii TaxID=652 RepID=A0A0S2SNU5_9GAMM|nr:hypothetical protein WL1483_3983 [Aeromonas schubertii]
MTNIFLLDNVDSFTYCLHADQFRPSKEQTHD